MSWEYASSEGGSALQRYAVRGWEAYAVTHNENGTPIYYMKRKVEQELRGVEGLRGGMRRIALLSLTAALLFMLSGCTSPMFPWDYFGKAKTGVTPDDANEKVSVAWVDER